jgi:hypothetical protein
MIGLGRWHKPGTCQRQRQTMFKALAIVDAAPSIPSN